MTVVDAETTWRRAALCALYLPGASSGWAPTSGCGSGHRPSAARVHAAAVAALLRQHPSPESWPEVLRRAGFWSEALIIDDLLARPVSPLPHALLADDDNFPDNWHARLGARVPPAFWVAGDLTVAPDTPLVGVVGSRDLSSADESFAEAVGAALAQHGYGVLSGGARGTDRAAVRGAAGTSRRQVPRWELLAQGLESPHLPHAGGSGQASCVLSACAPLAPFTVSAAMERNALIYAGGLATVVVRAHHGGGGTWHGSTGALRRQLGPVFVFLGDANFGKLAPELRRGAEGLVARGATAVRDLQELLAHLSALRQQPGRSFGLQAGLFA